MSDTSGGRRGEADETTDRSTAEAGWTVLHLFCHLERGADVHAIEAAFEAGSANGHQVVTAALFGHKGDLAIVGLGPSRHELRNLQTNLKQAGCVPNSSYLSVTECSEYASGLPEAMKTARLRPELPPEGYPAFCFYPMSKRRVGDDNWYLLDFEQRKALMGGHGAIGRLFHGRIVQLITGSTGLDDYEWGVTLFGRSFDDLKECVYTMRFDEASARYAEFGPFYTGTVGSPSEVLGAIGAY